MSGPTHRLNASSRAARKSVAATRTVTSRVSSSVDNPGHLLSLHGEVTFPALASPAIAAAGALHHRAGWRPHVIPF